MVYGNNFYGDTGSFSEGVDTKELVVGDWDENDEYIVKAGINADGVVYGQKGSFKDGIETTKVSLGTFDGEGNFTETMSLGNDGNASFAGDVSAANGNFSGKVTAKGVDAGNARVENVADAKNDTDAVNFRQLKAVSSSIEESMSFTKQTGAMSAALAGLNPMGYDPCSPTEVLAAVGTYKGETAVALGVSHYKDAKTRLGAGVSYSDGDFMANVNVAFNVGKGVDCQPGNDTDERIAQLERELAELRAMVAAQAN